MGEYTRPEVFLSLVIRPDASLHNVLNKVIILRPAREHHHERCLDEFIEPGICAPGVEHPHDCEVGKHVVDFGMVAGVYSILELGVKSKLPDLVVQSPVKSLSHINFLTLSLV